MFHMREELTVHATKFRKIPNLKMRQSPKLITRPLSRAVPGDVDPALPAPQSRTPVALPTGIWQTLSTSSQPQAASSPSFSFSP